MISSKDQLSQELVSLFDLKKSKIRDEKMLTHEAFEAQRDIRHLTLMFCDGVPDVSIPVTENESIFWDSKVKKLLYVNGDQVLILEGASREIRVRMRPYLTDLVRKAKSFYRDE
jgi:hypothetical protein